MTVGEAEGTEREDPGRYSDTFWGCPRCRMVVRRMEMEIHLAHAHDIGAQRGKREGGKDRRDRKERRDRD